MKLAHHTLLNLLGLGAPLLLALVTIPALVHELGTDRFGLLTLIWAVTSYFGLFDLGLGRALTQQLSVVLAQERTEDIGPLSATALSLMAALGVVAGVLMVTLASWGVDLIKSVPDREEAVLATILMGLGLPAIVLTSGLRGMLEAKHQFGVLNLIRLPMGMWTFAGPWLMVKYFGPDLAAIAAALVVGRVLALAAHAWFVWRGMPELHGRLTWRSRWLRPLCVSGGWLTLSNIVSPFMGYVDRFVIGATLSAAAVAFYATPQELVTKLWIIPGALTGVLFPTFAAQLARGDGHAWVLFDRAVAWLFVALLPITAGLALFAHELLARWIGVEFANHSAMILQVFALGILINCLAHVPLTWLQSAGHYRAPALLHCAELPLFMIALWLLSARWGLMGAALAWLLRMVLDSAILFWLVRRQRASVGTGPTVQPVLAAMLGVAAFAGLAWHDASARAIWWLMPLLGAATMAWRLHSADRNSTDQ